MSEVKVNKISPRSGTAFTLGDSGDTFTVPSGGTLTVASGATLTNSGTATGFAGIAWQAVTTGATLTAVAGKGYPIDTDSNACTVTLPASASAGDQIVFTDYTRNWGTNAVTLDINSLKFQKGDIDAVYETSGETVHIVYIDATVGWVPLYDGAVTDKAAVASGGTENSYSGYKSHTFLESADFVVTSETQMDIMMIAGGGGGGAWHSGGGGAGGMIVAADQTIAVGTYSIVIGAGATATLYIGNNGDDTTAFGDTCDGGGGSGAYQIANASDGGSGGGARGEATSPGGAATQGDPSTLSGTGYGYDGGQSTYNHAGGGGGGAGTIGASASTSQQGAGGSGLDNLYRTGSNVTYAGGGEGGTWSGSRSTTHAGLAGGGGIGGAGNEVTAPTAGVVNKGAGGGGRGGNTGANVTTGGNGGSGIVVIRYAR